MMGVSRVGLAKLKLRMYFWIVFAVFNHIHNKRLVKLYPASAIVITNCTQRKRRTTSEALLIGAVTATSLQALASEWLQKVDAELNKVTVRQLYVGRAFSEALAVARQLEAELFVVSAGLGLIHESVEAPNYNATVTEDGGSLKEQLNHANANSSAWWQALASSKGPDGFIHQLIRNRRPEITLIALPAAYVDLVSDDLAQISKDYIERVRIFTSPPGAARVPVALKGAVMPYDERLEGGDRPGTRTDFPQRAMRHFVEELGAASLSLNEASSRVKAALTQLKRREVPMRQRKSDEEVMQLLAGNWERFQGRSSRLLRFLRDEALVACEQGRFRGLWLQVRSAMSQKSSVHA